MGVKSCSRKGCSNVMCNTYVESIGYICIDCKDEFKLYLNNKGLNPKTEHDIIYNLESFMETYKGSYNNWGEISVDEFFNNKTS